MNKQIIDFINDLSEVDMEMVERPEQSIATELMEEIFGESNEKKRARKAKTKVLLQKKCMIINAFPLPMHPHELIALANLALSNHTTADSDAEKEAWKLKIRTVLNKVQHLLTGPEGEHIAEDYLFIKTEYEKIAETNLRSSSRKGFLGFFRK